MKNIENYKKLEVKELFSFGEISKKNYTDKERDYLISLYKTFLLIKGYYPNKKIIPSVEIDELWHNHLLSSKKYFKDCQNLFGKYLHHNPFSILSGIKLEESFIQTQILIEKHLPEIDSSITYQKEFGYAICSSCD